MMIKTIIESLRYKRGKTQAGWHGVQHTDA